MKKAGLIFLLLTVGTFTAQAQATIGGGLAYGTDVEEFGLGIDGEFYIKSDLSISPDFILYFLENDRSYWELNANINYYFVEGPASVYGVGGLNLSTFKFDPGPTLPSSSNTELGLNLGIGSNFDINASIEPFMEFKFVVGDLDQAVFFFGVKFPLR